VLAGHIDSTSGPAVSYRLRELRRVNSIRIRRPDGSVVRFSVEGTCSGDFDPSIGHFVDNTIVSAARVPERRAVPVARS
jgi:hypothetical protein